MLKYIGTREQLERMGFEKSKNNSRAKNKMLDETSIMIFLDGELRIGDNINIGEYEEMYYKTDYGELLAQMAIDGLVEVVSQ